MASTETLSPARPRRDDPSPSPSRSPSPGPAPRSPPRRHRSPPPRDDSPPPRDRSQSPSRREPSQSPPRRARSRSRSPPPPPRRHSPLPRRDAADRYRPVKRGRSPSPPPPPAAPPKTEEEKLEAARAEYQKLLNLRSQGVYLPPQRLRALQAAITDKTSKEYQRMAWEALKKSINGLVNKVNTANIKFVVPELFGENLIRGRGLFCQSLLKAQHASLPFTPIYACLAAICNTKLPQVGELLVKRLIMRFRKAFKRNDKAVCLSSTMFIAHLVNNQIVHEMIAAQILLLLLQKPTDDSVEIAVGLMREVGLFLEEMSPAIAHAVFDQFRNILHEADLDKRTQYMIEVLFQIRKDKYKDNPVIKEELDLVEEEDQITHRIGLDDDIETQDSLNIFKFDPNWEENENEYKRLKAEILGEGSDDEEDDDEDDDESGSESEEENEEQKAMEIKDQSNADLVNLRKTIYLSIQSSADPEEAAHKLMKLRLPPGQEPELVSMIVESCAQEKVYLKFMGLLGERFARLNRMWMELFEESFVKYYTTIHRYETNKLRNIARFFGHLLATDSIGWHVLSSIHLNEEETTASSRIFIKILFEDLQENMGTAKLKTRLGEDILQPSLQGIFPHDNARNIRFSINYFTSIKMGFLTEEMRTFLANMPKPALPAPPADDSDSESVSSYDSYTGSYSSRSRSRTPPRRDGSERGRSISRTPPRRIRDRSYTPSRSRSYSRSVSSRRSRSPYSRSPPPRRAAARDSRSPSPVRQRGYSPSPRRSISPGRPPRSRGRDYSPSPRRSRSPAPAARRVRSRSRSYSRSPLPVRNRQRSPAGGLPSRRQRTSHSPNRSRSPAPAPAPAPARAAQHRGRNSASPAPRRKFDRHSRSLSPASRDSRSPSRSPPRRPVSRSRSRSPVRRRISRSRSRSPLPPSRDGPANRYRQRSPSPYSARPPPPGSRGSGSGAGARNDWRAGPSSRRRGFSPNSPGANKRRRYSSSRSRSPSPPPAKRGRVSN